jgi:hypothetical protein
MELRKGKGKVVQLQARCGPEGSRRFSFSDFHDIQHMKVVRSSASHTGRLYPQECSWYSFSLEAESTQESEGNMSPKNPVKRPGIYRATARLVAQNLIHYATPGLKYCGHHLVNVLQEYAKDITKMKGTIFHLIFFYLLMRTA